MYVLRTKRCEAPQSHGHLMGHIRQKFVKRLHYLVASIGICCRSTAEIYRCVNRQVLNGWIVSGWWFQIFVIFHNIWNVIIATDFNSIIFQDGEIAPPTRYLRFLYRIVMFF